MTTFKLRGLSRALGLNPSRRAGSNPVPSYAATPVNFDGATHLTRGDGLTGASDSKVWSGSLWFRRSAPGGFTKLFTSPNANHELIPFGSDLSSLLILFGKSVSTGEFALRLDLIESNDTNWHHVMWSVNMENASERWAYLDGSAAGTWTTYADETLDFTDADFLLGAADLGGSSKFSGDMADVWLRFGGSVIDFSVEANRRLFITADGKPTNPNGWPSGGQVGLHGAVNDWHTNKLSGGGFTMNGTLAAGTGPVQLP